MQESGPPYAPDFPDGVNPDGARLLHKFKRQQERLLSDRRLSVGIAYSYAPNADAPGETLANEAVDPSQLTADDRAFLDEAIHDYNVQFGTAYETSAQGFEGYYKDTPGSRRSGPSTSTTWMSTPPNWAARWSSATTSSRGTK